MEIHKVANTYEKNKTASHFPEKGPIDEKTGKEILLSVKDPESVPYKGNRTIRIHNSPVMI